MTARRAAGWSGALLGGVVVAAWVLAQDHSAAAPVPQAGFQAGLRPAGAVSRVVSMAPSATEILFAVGAGAQVVGVTRYCEMPPEAKALPKIGGFIDPSLEAVLALRPDLVVTAPSEGNRKVVVRLVDLGVPVLLVPGTTLADSFAALQLVGEALGHTGEAKAVATRMRADLEEVARRVAGRPAPRVLLLYDRRPLVAAGPGSFGDELLRLAGGSNVCTHSRVPYPTLSMETVVGWAPEVILDASMAGQQDPDAAQREAQADFARFPDVPAVARGRVRVLPGGGLMRPGPSVGADVRRVAALLHPEAFSSQP